MIVIDASAAVEYLIGTAAGERVAERIGQADVALHAPHLLDLEVTHTLRRLVRSGTLDTARAEEAFVDLLALRVRRHAHTVHLPRVWALRDVMTAYDAAYVALAEVLNAPLLTRDARLARAHGHQARVEVIA